MLTSRLIALVTNIVIGAIEFIIALRIILKILGAGLAPFVLWVYQTSQPLLAPFEGMFPTTKPSGITPGSILEFSALFALLVYGFIGYLISQALAYLNYQKTIYYSNNEEQEVVEEKRVRRHKI